MLSYQSPARANAVLNAILTCFGPRTTALRFAVAYVTESGASLLMRSLAKKVGCKWDNIPKALVTSFDYGHTEPNALTYLQDSGVEIRIANIGADGSFRLSPSSSAFHPKLYLAVHENKGQFVVGSANLSRRALTVNSEVVEVTALKHLADIDHLWHALIETSVPLTERLLKDYTAARKRPSARLSTDEPVVPATKDATTVPVFQQAVEERGLQLTQFRAFWIVAGYLSGGSQSQVELPRYAQRFFGYDFDNYDDGQHVIGEPIINVGNKEWARPLAWHGNNRMERLNLPTPAQSKLYYTNQVILLERAGTYFRLSAEYLDSPRAESWRNESAAAGTLFRVSTKSQRYCGLI